MILPHDFRERWLAAGDKLIQFDPDALTGVPLPEEDRRFLIDAGLPHTAAPFLSFDAPSRGPIRQVSTVWRVPESLPPHWMIGSNGSGDPICVSAAGHVFGLNHDNRFEVQLINSSIVQLAETLLVYREVVRRTQAAGGEDAFLDNRIPVEVQEWFLTELE